MRCGDCQWWLAYTKNGAPTGAGDCHRYPPQQVVQHYDEREEYDSAPRLASSVDDYWPTTEADDFCGEWKRQEGKQ